MNINLKVRYEVRCKNPKNNVDLNIIFKFSRGGPPLVA